MPDEATYAPLPVTDVRGRTLAQTDLPMPDMQYARPMGAWVIVAALFIVVVGLWATVAVYFSLHA
jgi:hypothetical protein